MTSFIPEQKKADAVPYYEDVTSDAGWQGHATGKGVETLKSEIAKSISRLGAHVMSFQRGVFEVDGESREGFQIRYILEGQKVEGRLDVAALPVRSKYDMAKKDKSLRMALYMVRNAMDGLWFLQQLSPGYAALMPWMLAQGDKTVSQLWAESAMMSNLLPPGESEFVEGEVVE